MTSNLFQRSMPVLPVPDVQAAVGFWRDRLGFEVRGQWGEPPCFAIVGRDLITIALDLPESATYDVSSGWSAYLYVEKVDELAAELKARGVSLLWPLEDAPYGCRDFTIEAPGGHKIAFGTDLSPGSAGPGL